MAVSSLFNERMTPEKGCNSPMQAKVVVFQRQLLHYRVEFFDRLHAFARQRGIALNLVYGERPPRGGGKEDEDVMGWSTLTPTRHCSVGAVNLVWHRTPAHLRDADLVVLMQENRILSNYPYLARRWAHGPLVAFWGHGANFQSNTPNGLRERWKRFLLGKVDYWFAYTEATAGLLARAGYPATRISVLQN